MKKKKIMIAAVFLFTIAAISVKILGNTQAITQNDLDSCDNKANIKNISQVMLNDTGRTGEVKRDDIKSVKIKYGDVNGDSSVDAVICADYGDDYSLVAAYKKDGDVYTYINEIGVFSNILQTELSNMKNLKRDVTFIKEKVSDKATSFEENVYLKGYAYNDKLKCFTEVLNYPVSIECDWNTVWDGGNEKSSWHKLVQKTKSELTDGKVPKISMEHDQKFYISSDNQAKNVPNENTYKLQSKKSVKDEFIWSDKWNRFILDEKVDKTTGKNVAVILYWNRLPYVLDDEFENYSNLVKIVNGDSSTAIVKNDMLTDIRKTFIYTSADL